MGIILKIVDVNSNINRIEGIKNMYADKPEHTFSIV